jgi:hypothetical protein
MDSSGGRKWAKGPYRVFLADNGFHIIGIGDRNAKGITDCGFGVWGGGDAESLATANLLAAAPALFEALEAIHRELVRQEINFGPLIADAEDALSQASGKRESQ